MFPASVASPPTAAAESVTRAVEHLAASERPVILAGGGAHGASELVTGIAERLHAPVVTTANGKSVIDEGHHLSVGAGVHHPSVRELLTDSDAVLAIGTELAPSDFWTGAVPLSATLIRVDVDAASMLTNAEPAICLLGDAGTVLADLLGALAPCSSRRVERAESARARLRADAAAEGGPWLEITDALASIVDERTVIAGDSAMACYYGVLSNLPVRRSRGFLYPTGMGTLGYGLPAAIGAATADPQAQVLAILGDGGVMFTIPELATAAQLKIGMPVLVVDNEGYGEIRNEMEDRGEPLNAVMLGGVDFPAVARGMGCFGITITKPDELPDAIRTSFAADRPTLLHIREAAPS